MCETMPAQHAAPDKKKVVVLAGPTGAGKTSMALRIAASCGAEIVSADSMQIYRGLDIGTAKPTHAMRESIPHHLIDIVNPDESYHAARFQSDADRAVADICRNGKVPLVVGGTGLYIKALLRGLFQDARKKKHVTWGDRLSAYSDLGEHPHERLAKEDPEAARRIHPHDDVRAQRALDVYLRTGRSITEFQTDHGYSEHRYRACMIGLTMDREKLYERINDRVDRMIRAGLLDEVRSLLDSGYEASLPSMQGLGYRHMHGVLEGSLPMADAVRLMKRDTRHYAKRQMTWFQNKEKVTWYHPSGGEKEICNAIQCFLEQG